MIGRGSGAELIPGSTPGYLIASSADGIEMGRSMGGGETEGDEEALIPVTLADLHQEGDNLHQGGGYSGVGPSLLKKR